MTMSTSRSDPLPRRRCVRQPDNAPRAPLRRLRRPSHGLAARPPHGLLRVDVQPDSEVPAIVDLRAKREHAVDDQDRVRCRGCRHRRVIDLGERVDAAQHAVPGSGRGGRIEQKPRDRRVVECVAVVALARLSVIEVPIPPRPLKSSRLARRTGRPRERSARPARDRSWSCPRRSVHRDSTQPTVSQRQDPLGHMLEHRCPLARGRRRQRLPPCRDRHVHLARPRLIA